MPTIFFLALLSLLSLEHVLVLLNSPNISHPLRINLREIIKSKLEPSLVNEEYNLPELVCLVRKND